MAGHINTGAALNRLGKAEGAIHLLLLLLQAGNGRVVLVALGFGDLTAQITTAVLKLTAAQRPNRFVQKFGSKCLVLLHQH
jgi:hypothetical protein